MNSADEGVHILEKEKVLTRTSTEDILNAAEETAMNVLGHLLVSHDKLQDAITLFEALNIIYPNRLYTQKVLAYLYVETECFAAALSTVRKLRDLLKYDDSSSAIANLLEGRALRGMGEAKEADKCLKDYRYELSLL